jgi:hypothetical protein
MRSWNILSVVSGEINSSSIQYYSVEERDFNKVPGNYYRLKQTDIDGRSKYYDILTRTCKSAPATLQFVGINSNGLNIDISFNSYASDNVTIEVFDINGKVMINENIVPVEGTNILTVQTPGFKSGIYMVSILQNDNRVSKKIMVK